MPSSFTRRRDAALLFIGLSAGISVHCGSSDPEHREAQPIETGGAGAGSGGSSGSGIGAGGTSNGASGSGAHASGGANGSGGATGTSAEAGGTAGTGGQGAGAAGQAAGGAGTSLVQDSDASASQEAGNGDPSGTVALPGFGMCRGPAAARPADIEAAYTKFKTDLVTSSGAAGFLRVTRPNSPGVAVNTTASEGIGYGMLIAVYMNDQATFDQFWKYEQKFLDSRGLMNWEINPQGTGPSSQGSGAATDGDEDMAFALVMASKKWGGSGTLGDTYLNIAKKQIDLIWQNEVDHARADVVTPGDQFGGGQVINISYFAPAYYRVFGQITGKTAEWTRAIDASYQALNAALNATNGNVDNGLIPAWSTPAGVPTVPANTSHPVNHQLDSCRTPFRIGQDYCWFSEPRALTYLQKISKFYAGIGAANIVDSYELKGTPSSGAMLHLAAFVGPAGVGAMSASAHATLLGEAYRALVTPPGLLGGSLYYNESWTVLSLLMMSGKMLNLAN